MPFTAAHPAIILPTLKSRWVSASAIIIGSVCPDFEYFIRTEIKSEISHTIEGLIFFNLPIGFLIWFLLHTLIKKPLIYSMPQYIRSRLSNFYDHKITNSRNILIIPVSIIIGAASHIFWDSFTHHNGYFVSLLGLDLSLNLSDLNVRFYRIFQHGSTFVGIIVIGIYFHRLKVFSEVVPHKKSPYWLAAAITAIVFMSVKVLISGSVGIGELIVSIISSILSGILVASLFLNYRYRL